MISFGRESFYIISNNGTNVSALAKNNLNVGIKTYSGREIGIQFNDQDVLNGFAIATTNFSDTSVTYAGSKIEGYVNNYKDKLIAMGANILEMDLITNEELESSDIKCMMSNYGCYSAPQFIYSSAYWTMSSTEANYVWRVNVNKAYCGEIYTHDFFGVRPVITVSFDVSIDIRTHKFTHCDII